MKTAILNPIGIKTQIQDALTEASAKQNKNVSLKIQFVKDNIDNIEKINGKKVYNPIADEEYINYNLQKCPKMFIKSLLETKKRKYYYPIQYANIKLKNNNQ
jgi:hypothetical protein